MVRTNAAGIRIGTPFRRSFGVCVVHVIWCVCVVSKCQNGKHKPLPRNERNGPDATHSTYIQASEKLYTPASPVATVVNIWEHKAALMCEFWNVPRICDLCLISSLVNNAHTHMPFSCSFWVIVFQMFCNDHEFYVSARANDINGLLFGVAVCCGSGVLVRPNTSP